VHKQLFQSLIQLSFIANNHYSFYPVQVLNVPTIVTFIPANGLLFPFKRVFALVRYYNNAVQPTPVTLLSKWYMETINAATI